MEEGQTAGRKRGREEEEPDSSHSASSSVTMTTDPVGGVSLPCVSLVIRVENKEGVAWRNIGAELNRRDAGLILCFSVRAAVIGPAVTWGRDPKNRPMTDRETGTEKDNKVRNINPPHYMYLCSGCHLVTCVSAGRPGVLRCVSSLVSCPTTWIFLQNRRCQHTGKCTTCHDVSLTWSSWFR